MTDPHNSRPVNERKRFTMRLAVVALGYIVYRFLAETSLAGALLVGFGIWLVGVTRVERQLNPEATERQRMLQTVGTGVGIGMIAVGTVFAVI